MKSAKRCDLLALLLNSVELTACSLNLTIIGLVYDLHGRISHIPSVEFKPISIMNNSIHTSIGVGVILEHIIPVTDWYL